MGDSNKMDFSLDSVGSVTIPNGYPKHRLAAADSPAFWPSEPYTNSTGTLTRDFVVNHLVHPRAEEGRNGINVNNKTYSSNTKSNGFVEMYDTAHHPLSFGYIPQGVSANNGFGKSQTLGRRAITKPSTLGMATKRPHTVFGTLSRHHPSSENAAYISFFDIEIDKVSTYQYRPGEQVTGTINIIVRKNLEIRFVDMIVTGQGLVTTRRPSDGFPQTFRETYLQKEKCIIGSKDVPLDSVLTPGQYTSKFRVKLPADLPSTAHHEDDVNGLTLDISYTIKVRLCDDVSAPQARHGSFQHNKLRVLLEKQMNFNVKRGFDLSSIPDAMSPITHTEQIYLSCTHQEAAIVSVNLDRAVFLAGDDIRMQLQVSLPSSQNVKEVTCKLQQLVRVSPKHDPITFVLSNIIQKDPYLSGRKTTNRNTDQNVFDVTIPTKIDLISPYSLGSSKLKVEYFLAIDLKFAPAGGKLTFKVPVGIGPCADPIYAEKTLSRKMVPFFNRTTRFPCFSAKTLTQTSPSRPPNAKSAASVQVTTKYSNGLFARCFLCCLGAREV